VGGAARANGCGGANNVTKHHWGAHRCAQYICHSIYILFVYFVYFVVYITSICVVSGDGN